MRPIRRTSFKTLTTKPGLNGKFSRVFYCPKGTLHNYPQKKGAIFGDMNVNLKFTHSQIQKKYLQPIITQYFIDNKSEIWLLFLIAHSKR